VVEWLLIVANKHGNEQEAPAAMPSVTLCGLHVARETEVKSSRPRCGMSEQEPAAARVRWAGECVVELVRSSG
jgi:hypothetical protein